MPNFKVTYVSEHGGEQDQVVTASTTSDAAAVVALGGHRVLRVDDASPYTVGSTGGAGHVPHSLARRSGGNMARNFWAFRLMLTPDLIRIQFVIGTVVLALVLVAIPVMHLVERNNVASGATPHTQRVEQIQRVRAEIAGAEAELDRVTAEIVKKSTEAPGSPQLRDLEAKKADIERRMRSSYASVNVRNAADLQRELAEATSWRDMSLASMPSVTRTVLTMLFMPILWIAYRIACEWLIIFFSIHERLVELRR